MVANYAPRRGTSAGAFGIVRSSVLGLSRLAALGLSSVVAAPLGPGSHYGDVPEETEAERWVLFVIAMVLVVSGGAFAGLTIAFMGQDSMYLQVVSGDASEPQCKNATRVRNLLSRGKHWVLVTLLLANVVVNESLPVVLDRCLGGGVEAIVGSTVLIVIFGEVVPQSICVRYGLQIGGIMAKPVLVMMWLLAPIAWPIAKLLDWALGTDHGTVYKKSGLKTLVTLHKSLGAVGERLNQDEVTIISAVLDLKEKPVYSVMTPMDDVFVMAEDTVLDEKTMDKILSAGYSRIPIHAPGNPRDFVGMLLVKILITYDPEDACQVKDFPLATLPETRPETSCLDIVNFFQEGKSHMVLVSEHPGEARGALGVVTLEDVIEELIGEEIIDESDVYIDVHKAIRRLTPAPKARPYHEGQANRGGSQNGKLIDVDDSSDSPASSQVQGAAQQDGTTVLSTSPGQKATFLMRRSSAGPDGRLQESTVPVKANLEELKNQLKHLGPSNRNTNPRDTRSTTVKIKSIVGSTPAHMSPSGLRPVSLATDRLDTSLEAIQREDESTPLMQGTVSGRGGAQAVRRSYGGAGVSDAQARLAAQTAGDLVPDAGGPDAQKPTIGSEGSSTEADNGRSPGSTAGGPPTGKEQGSGSGGASSTNSGVSEGSLTPKHHIVRSGSISENVVETSTGVRKIIIQASGAGADPDDDVSGGVLGGSGSGGNKHGREGEQVVIEEASGDEGENVSEVTPAGGPSSSTATTSSPPGNEGRGDGKKKNKKKKKKGKS